MAAVRFLASLKSAWNGKHRSKMPARGRQLMPRSRPPVPRLRNVRHAARSGRNDADILRRGGCNIRQVGHAPILSKMKELGRGTATRVYIPQDRDLAELPEGKHNQWLNRRYIVEGTVNCLVRGPEVLES